MTDHSDDRSARAVDLGLVVAAVVAANVFLLAVDAPWPVVWAVGVPFLLVCPGYGVVSALFPEPAGRVGDAESRPWGTPDAVSRIGLSLVSSAVVVALVGLALAVVGVLRLAPAVLAISAVTLACVLVAVVRRRRLQPAARRSPSSDEPGSWERLAPGSTLQTAAMLFALVVLLGAVAYTGAAPSQSQSYTEFYLLSEDENGELTAANYPETFVSGEGHPLYVGLENNEHEPVEYEVVLLAQAVSDDGSVVVQQRVDRFDVQLEHGADTAVERNVAPTIVGEEIRLQVLLYRGDVPENPSADTADQSLRLWIDVIEDES